MKLLKKYFGILVVNLIVFASCNQPSKIQEVIDGKVLYERCVTCHQPNGQGVPNIFPPLDASTYVVSDNVERLASIMLFGLKGPIKVNGQEFNSMMLPQRHLSDRQLAAIATFIRSSWSNKTGPVDPAVFAKMREKWGIRIQFQISELGEE